MKFSFGKIHYRMLSRKAILATAAVLAVTGATGAAALLAPSDLGLSRLVPTVTAQVVTPGANDDISSQLPFVRVVQAPIPNITPTVTDSPAAVPAARPSAARAPAIRGPIARGPVARAPVAQGPVAQTPIAQTPIAAPEGRQIMTSSPDVIVHTQHVKTRRAHRPRYVYVSDEHCND